MLLFYIQFFTSFNFYKATKTTNPVLYPAKHNVLPVHG